MKQIITFLILIVISHSSIAQTADFTYQTSDGLYCEPSVIQFTSSHTGTAIGYVWDFGDGNGSNVQHPQNIYNLAGVYTVKLLVIYDQMTVEVIKLITINRTITAAITFDRNYICTPGVINFTATSSGNIANYQWDFGDGTGIVNTTTNTAPHNYTSFGDYYITLKVTDVSGCFATATSHVAVEKPQISGTVTPTSGCIPSNVNFTANVLVPVSGSVTSYTWDFGDGSPVVSTTVNNTSHVYTAVGNYQPKLDIVTNEGCTNRFNYPAVAYGIPPTGHIAYPKKLVVCGSETPQFVSKAVNANTYRWDFGDGTIVTVTDTITSHKYTTLGTKTITVTPAYNGCPGTPITFSIDVVGVISGFTYANTCSNPKQYTFTNTSQGILSTTVWDFGDGSPTVNTMNAVHGFPQTGAFNTSLTVTDNASGCSDVFTEIIYTANPSLVNPDSSICKNSNTTFTISNNYTNAAATYIWHVAGLIVGPTDTASLTLNANLLGNFTSNFVVINNGPESCPDTVTMSRPLLVRGPNLSFTSATTVCLGSPFSVTNTSQPYRPADSVLVWYWNFGISANDTVYQPQPFSNFLYPGTWDVKLTAIDKNGCKDTLNKVITVHPKPFLHSIPGVDTLCLGQPDTLIAFHTDNILWSPSNLFTCATCDTVIVNPTTTTTYYVTATNSFNCIARDSVLLNVYTPFTAAATPSNVYTCVNDPVQLNVSPPGKQVVWSPATGLSNANIYDPIASPTQPTTYTATLTDSVGCFTDSVNVNVIIKALPTVDAGPDRVYPYNSSYAFTPVYSSNVASYLWDPSNQLDCSNCPAPNGIAAYTQTYTLTVTSDSGCVAKDNITIFVECKSANLLLPTAFTPNGDNVNDYFYPITRGIKTIAKLIIYNRQGQLVFEARNFSPNNRQDGWDGKYKGVPQNSAAFVYFLEAVCEAGETLQKKGSVMLLR